jgi:response regulator aspartate phosphatase I
MSQKFKTFIIQIVVVNDGICSKMTLNRKKSGEVYIQGEDEGILIEKIASENVAEMLNEWYSMIRQNKVNKAVTIKGEIEEALPFMEKNQNLIIYFTLLDFRHKIMLKNLTETTEIFNQLEKESYDKTEEMIQYYFYFFGGQHEFYNRNYIKAVKYYQAAENKLQFISDDIEKAEFHYQLGNAFYRIDQHFYSLMHGEKALEIFKYYGNYAEKTLNCEMLLAANLVDLGNYDKAKVFYYRVLKNAEEKAFPITLGLANHNLGLCYQKQKEFDLAVNHFNISLTIPEHNNSYVGVKTLYELTYSLYQDGSKENASQFFEKGFDRACSEENNEYITKFKLLHAVYEFESLPLINSGLAELEKLNLWTDIVEISYNIGCYFEEKGYFEKAVIYLKRSHQAKVEIMKMGEVVM